MDLVQIEKACIQPAQTGFRRPQQIIMTQMRTGDLGRDEYPIANPADRLRDHVLGPVHLRGIDQRWRPVSIPRRNGSTPPLYRHTPIPISGTITPVLPSCFNSIAVHHQ